VDRTRILVIPFLAALTFLLMSANASRAAGPVYYISETSHLTPAMNQLESFDISWVDPRTETYVFTDRSNKGLDVFNASNGQFIRNIPGFKGVSTGTSTCSNGGPNGVLIIPTNEDDDGHGNTQGYHFGDHDGNDRGLAYAGDGDSTLKIADLNSGKIVATLSTGGNCRADELAYDPHDRIVAIANDQENPPYLTFFSTDGGHANLGKLSFTGATGLEQTAYDPDTRHFWVAVPTTTAHPDGELDEIDPTTRTILFHFAMNPGCNPTGLTLGPNDEALTACKTGAQIVNLQSHTFVALISAASGADEVWFNPGDHNYYVPVSSAGNLYIIDGQAHSLVDTVALPGGSKAGSHSVAANARNNFVFIPVKDQAAAPAHDQGVAIVTKIPGP
jgi:DNA-binding beta-propeller fold protein YncE